MKRFVLDTHTHTTASGHAYGTVLEMAKAASEAGLSLLAVTDHAPKMPGGPDPMYFCNFKVIPPTLYGVGILMGAELNVIDYRGTVDLEEGLLKRMAVCIASLHTVCLVPGSRRENTRALLGAMENPHVHVIGHPDDGHYPLDYEELIRGAKAAGVLIEVNNSSLVPGGSRTCSRENLGEILRLCRKLDQQVVVNTDSHFPASVGRFDEALKLLEENHFPGELAVNPDPEQYKKDLNRSGL